LTLAIVSDTDITPYPDPSQCLQAKVVGVEELETIPLRDAVIASEITNFQQHVQNVFSFLKKAASLEQQKRKMKEDGQETTKVSSQYTKLQLDLKFYITRTCFEKMSVRAGYHCAAVVDSKDPKEDDFTRLLYPMCSWRTAHLKLAEQFGTQLSDIYRSVLSKEPFSFNLKRIFKDDKDEMAKFDPNMWTDDQWTNPVPLHSGFLRNYEPVVERQIWQGLAQMYELEDIPNEKGFYLTARGRRAYHQLVTTCVWNAL
jgi:hypothetical protein